MGADPTQPRWRDPWPSPQTPYYDPPWLMRGRAATAWFQAPWDVATATLSPALLPEAAPRVKARLRFYDLEFEAPFPSRELPLAERRGRFREAVVAFHAKHADLDGEVSTFLWTDSNTYQCWGREVFDWPIGRGDLTLEGPLWNEPISPGSSGTAHVTERFGIAGLLDVRVVETAARGTPSGLWLTPRRVLHAAGAEGETRELLVVHPEVRNPGRAYVGTGRVHFDFEAPHPLAELGDLDDVAIEIADGFELLIGSKVDALLAESIAAGGAFRS
jgi:hypothetical protein